jgi:DNA-binding GntR family transcriptional regulator
MYLPADRPVTLKLLKRIHDNIDRYLRLEVSLSAGRGRAFREHEELLAHCRAGNVPAALDLLERHIQQTANGLIDHLRARETAVAAD